MNTIKLLLILTSLQGRIHSYQDIGYCSYQMGFITVEEGGSVTISCSFSCSKKGDKTELKVSWRSGQTRPCGVDTNTFIYNHMDNFIHQNYSGRIFVAERPTGQNTASIRIKRLKRTDGPMFCCRVDILKEGKITDGFYNRPGTYLRFPGQTYVDQLDIVPANRGETIIIPCDLHKPPGDNETVQQVIWRVGDSDLCRENDIEYRWGSHKETQSNNRLSLVDFPENISLRITGVTTGDERWYCCQVTTGNRGSTYRSAYSTELVIVNNGVSDTSKLTVEQPTHSSADTGDSITISCSFTYSKEISPLWIGVYWRTENPSGDYAYHPSPEVIHPEYRDRTGLTGQADLLIHNVKETDNTTYYCLVILRECVGNNKFNTTIVQGRGTKLSVTGDAVHNQHTSAYLLHYYQHGTSEAFRLAQTRIILIARLLGLCVVILGGILAYRNVRRIVLNGK